MEIPLLPVPVTARLTRWRPTAFGVRRSAAERRQATGRGAGPVATRTATCRRRAPSIARSCDCST